MIIYKITNKLNGTCYIGQTTKSLERRWKEHCKLSSKCRYLNYAIKKYGKESFSINTISKYDNLVDLNNAEEYYIDWYNSLVPNGYNLDSGGKSKKPSKETKQKQSDVKLGKHLSQRTEIKPGQRLSPKTEFKKGMVSLNKKQIIDLESGFVFGSLAECALAFNISNTLLSWKIHKSKYNNRFKFVKDVL